MSWPASITDAVRGSFHGGGEIPVPPPVIPDASAFTAIYSALVERIKATGNWDTENWNTQYTYQHWPAPSGITYTGETVLPQGDMKGKFRSRAQRRNYEFYRNLAIPYFIDAESVDPTANNVDAAPHWTLESMADAVGADLIEEGIYNGGGGGGLIGHTKPTTADWIVQQYEILRRMTWTGPPVAENNWREKDAYNPPWVDSWPVDWDEHGDGWPGGSLWAGAYNNGGNSNGFNGAAFRQRVILDIEALAPAVSGGDRHLYFYAFIQKPYINVNNDPGFDDIFWDAGTSGFIQDEYNMLSSSLLSGGGESVMLNDVFTGGDPGLTMTMPPKANRPHRSQQGYRLRPTEYNADAGFQCYVNYGITNGFTYGEV